MPFAAAFITFVFFWIKAGACILSAIMLYETRTSAFPAIYPAIAVTITHFHFTPALFLISAKIYLTVTRKSSSDKSSAFSRALDASFITSFWNIQSFKIDPNIFEFFKISKFGNPILGGLVPKCL
jgi:hypothetical protein